jgi:hypothetical protein
LSDTHLIKTGTRPNRRIYAQVSQEVYQMWQEINEYEQKSSKKDIILLILWKN